MNLGKPNKMEMAIPAKPSKAPKVSYPTVTIEKPVGNYEYGDTFTAIVKFRVRKIEHGKDWSEQATHRCTLEMISMEPTRAKKKGFPSY